MGRTALRFAASSADVAEVNRPLAAGTEVGLPEKNGNTPLSNSVFYSTGERSLIARLWHAGADPRRADRQGMSPMALARTMADPRPITHFEGAGSRRPRVTPHDAGWCSPPPGAAVAGPASAVW